MCLIVFLKQLFGIVFCYESVCFYVLLQNRVFDCVSVQNVLDARRSPRPVGVRESSLGIFSVRYKILLVSPFPQFKQGSAYIILTWYKLLFVPLP